MTTRRELDHEQGRLIKRIVTGVTLAATMTPAVLLLPTVWVASLLALFLVIGSIEWAALAGAASTRSRLIYAFVVLASASGVWLLEQHFPVSPYVIGIGTVWWMALVIWLRFCPARRRTLGCGELSLLPLWRRIADSEDRGARLAKLMAGLVTLIPAWIALAVIHHDQTQGPRLLWFMLAMIVVADTAAYFVGRHWGRRPLAPGLSPGKTLEGFYGGMGMAMLVALLGAWVLEISALQWPFFLLLCFATVGFSVIGDLFESLLKRAAGTKDSGVLLPGHGGVLDRIDSVLGAAPVFAGGALLIGLLR